MRPFRETGMAHLYCRKAWEVRLSRNAGVVPKAPFRTSQTSESEKKGKARKTHEQ
jgi:hypothetical protein